MLERQRVEKTVSFVGARARNTVFPLLYATLRPRKRRFATNALIHGGKSHGGFFESEYMHITSLLHQVDPCIGSLEEIP